MSWKVALPLGALMFGASIFGLIELEKRAPFEAKPSILLRASAGDRTAIELPARYEAEAAAALKAQEAAAAAAIEAQAAHATLQVSRAALQALNERIQEKQTTQWASALPPR